SNGTRIGAETLMPGQQYPLAVDQDVDIGASLLTVTAERSWDMTRVNTPVYKPKFVGVLYTDIVNSTIMTARLGPEGGTTLLEWHNKTLRDRFKRYGGRETKFTGDGFEVVFNSVTDALGCSAACQRALARRNQQDPHGWKLEVRMGVNGGEAPSSGKRVYGMPLIIAARVMSVAGAEQVWVPAHVAGIVAGSLLQFTPIGARDLKGIEQPMELLDFRWQLDPSVQSPLDVDPAGTDLGGRVSPQPGGRRTGVSRSAGT
ncbi:MAG: adenylate/guanylate cyclase domain-containing protein, partial [Dehalococcoidia bacterium]